MHILGGRLLLSLESAESESLQKLFTNIRGQSDFRMRTCDVCNRLAYACVYRGCQKGVDLARIRSAEYGCRARDLSALVDRVSHGCVEVGTCRKQRFKVGHHAVLPDEGKGPVEVGVLSAPHHLALVPQKVSTSFAGASESAKARCSDRSSRADLSAKSSATASAVPLTVSKNTGFSP